MLARMPMLADIEDPPKSRMGGILLGLLLATPIVGLFALYLIPMAVGSILGGARDLDERLRANDAYMNELCGVAYVEGRDETLCNCVWMMDFPSLDCAPQFNVWALAHQSAACDDPTTHDASLTFCSCIEAVEEKVAAADDAVFAAAAYERCEVLEDALPLPTIESLTPPET